MRVATYTRISTDEEHQPFSLEAQAQKLAAYVSSQDGWALVQGCTDRMSGATLERPGLDAALEAAKAGKYDLLLVYRVDRLARSVRGLAHVVEELDAAGVAFRSATEPFDTASPAGRMMVQMLGVFAEFERATIMDRVINGMERKAQKGGWCGGRRPFGYVHDKERGVLVPKADEAPLVPVIFDRYARRDMSSTAIAKWLNEAGHRTKDGKPWSSSSVLTVLRNRTYLGEVTFRGITRADAHEPLVNRAIFEAAVRLAGDRGARAPRANVKPTAEYLLSGLLTCSRCGKHYVGTAATGTATATTPAGRECATAPSPATPSACPPTSWTTPSWRPSSTSTATTPSSTGPWHGRPSACSRRAGSSPPNSTPPRPASPTWSARSRSTCGPSRPGPCPTRSAASACGNSATRESFCEPAGTSWPRPSPTTVPRLRHPTNWPACRSWPASCSPTARSPGARRSWHSSSTGSTSRAGTACYPPSACPPARRRTNWRRFAQNSDRWALEGSNL